MSERSRQILTASRFFQQVHGESLDRLLAMALLRKYARNETIFRQGDPCPGVYVVGEGQVRVFKRAPSGKEHVLHFVDPGLTFAEVAAIGGFDCPAYAEATCDTTCVLLPTAPFNHALKEDHDLSLQIMASMAFWVRHLVGLMEDIVLRDAAGRLAQYLLEASSSGSDTFELPTLKKDVASHLNLTSETFSRTLKRLERSGLIEQVDGGALRVLRRDDLKNLADGLFPTL